MEKMIVNDRAAACLSDDDAEALKKVNHEVIEIVKTAPRMAQVVCNVQVDSRGAWSLCLLAHGSGTEKMNSLGDAIAHAIKDAALLELAVKSTLDTLSKGDI